jgi:1-acyl-sn-glycerol-3-phosphate acyltransferase
VADLVYPPIITLARVLFTLQGLRFDIRGAQNIPRTGGAVLAINHVGYFDFTYAGYAARPAGRLVRFMAKSEVFSHPVAGPLMRGMKHISVDRSAGAASFRRAIEVLRAGEIVGVFPEATISMSFELKEFKNGAVRMASDAGVPLIPTVIWGSQRVWTKGRPKRLGRHKVPIHIAVGEPMHPSSTRDHDSATRELRERMAVLLEELQRTYPDRPANPQDGWWLPARLGGTAPTPERAKELEKAIRAEQLARYRAKAAKAATRDS